MSVKHFAWDDAKNAKLKPDRGIGFEEIVCHIERDDLLDIREYPNPEGLTLRSVVVSLLLTIPRVAPRSVCPAARDPGLATSAARTDRGRGDCDSRRPTACCGSGCRRSGTNGGGESRERA
jgi:hypothetical protein